MRLSRGNTSGRRLRFEHLERRTLLTATPIETTFLDGNGLETTIDPEGFVAGLENAQSALLSELDASMELFLTTADAPANRITPAGAGFDGVVELRVYPDINNLNAFVRGTATLLPNGQTLLTAAHLLTSSPVQAIAGIFTTPLGNLTIFANAAAIHPQWTGNPLNSPDIATVQLVAPAPQEAERYDIFRDANEVASQFDTVGYGRSGTGAQGSILGAGTKRDGDNRFDALGQALNGTVYTPGTLIANSHLVFDFDNGNANTDAGGFFLGVNNLGLGAIEVSTAPGDSGGPAFLGNRIAGVTSFGVGFNGATDVLAGTNSSFGEFAIDTRVSAYVDWIDAFIDVAGAARITDVIVRGSSWADGVEYAFSDIVPNGKQFAPIYTDGANTIQIAFSEHVLLTEDAIKLYQTGARHGNNLTEVTPVTNGFHYDVGTHIATWTFPALDRDKYRIEIAATGVTDAAGNLLDGDWDNITNNTLDNFSDDPTGREFLSGNGTAGGAFEFLFAYLPGDYDQNGVVNAADEVLWNDEQIPVDGDGDGDGIGDSGDYSVWSNSFSDQLAMLKNYGDYDDNDIVDVRDYAQWRSTYGDTGANLAADGNGNGEVDTADYVQWNYWKETVGAWNAPIGGLGALLTVVDFGNAPRVTNVTISGSSSTHDPYSFADHDGSGEQLQTVPVGGADTISVAFSEDVNVTAEMLRLVELYTAAVPVLVDFAYDISTMTATWRLENAVSSLPALFGMYIIALDDAVTDIEGNRLDGEWANAGDLYTTDPGVNVFPSGDGDAGGDFNFLFVALPGDADQDNFVSSWDYGVWLAHNGMAGAFADGDFSGDGFVDETDFEIWESMSEHFDSHPFSPGTICYIWVLADLNFDWVIDGSDVQILMNNWTASNPGYLQGDLNADGIIDSSDLNLILAMYGLQFTAVGGY